MSDDLTPWEDINPPMASATRHEPPCRSSVDEETRTVFRNELTACLALTAPVGMTEENRRDWLMVAWDTLKHIPPDILAIGASAARKKCDHPCKIVPTIIAETEQMMNWREPKRSTGGVGYYLPPPDENYCTQEEARKILSEFGFKRNPLDISPTGGR